MKKIRLSSSKPARKTTKSSAQSSINPLFNRAQELQRQGSLAEALAVYQLLLDVESNHVEGLRISGALHIQLRQYEPAALKLAKLVSLRDDISEAWIWLATALSMLEKQEQALTVAEQGLQLDPASPFAHNTKGTILRKLGQPANALVCYDRALELDPFYGDAWNNKGVALLDLNRYADSVSALERASQLDPHSAPIHVNLGNALRENGQYGEATIYYHKALQFDPEFKSALFNESMMQLSLGDFTNGWRNYESRWQSDTFPSPHRDFTQPLWLGKGDLRGKTILLHSEQGLGDAIQFCRFIPLVAALGATVIVEVDASLTALLLTAYGNTTIFEKGQPLPAFDVHCPFMSLPLAFGMTVETTPSLPHYLMADASLVGEWLKRLGAKRGPRVGLVWAGNPRHINDRNRSIPLQTLLSSLSIKTRGIEWISLQKEMSTEDFGQLAQKQTIKYFGAQIRDFTDTAALIAHMDVVITVDTAVAHLAGAMGKPVWLLVSHAAEWRWLQNRSDSPWYPSMRIFRQPVPGDWQGLLQQVDEALRAEWGDAIGKVDAAVHTDIGRWSNPDSLEASWNSRAQIVAQYIPDGARVLDIGCGKMVLEQFLPLHCAYQPCDLVARDERTIICDLNKMEFPVDAISRADIITLLGVIEYVIDLPALFSQLHASGRRVVVTYHTTNMTVGLNRNALGWLNNLSNNEIAKLFVDAGFSVTNMEKLSDIQLLFTLSPVQKPKLASKRVAVLSYANVGNFGDRLGYHLLHSVLPANAVVDHFFFKPWNVPDLTEYDLLVLGIGNSLFEPIMTDELERALEQVPHAIGIFGTQYRNEIDTSRMSRILARLDRWYARHEEDILLFGRSVNNAVHLGDWLIDAFPMAIPTVDTPLIIGDEILQDRPLDRTIQMIQRHKAVVSTRLHPLLCALTSADIVQYCEQREGKREQISGKFRSMLIDIFGRHYPENIPWTVDKKKIMQYKQRVSCNIKMLREDLSYLLNGENLSEHNLS